MHGLYIAMMLAAGSHAAPRFVAPYQLRWDYRHWGEPIAPGRNPLDRHPVVRPDLDKGKPFRVAEVRVLPRSVSFQNHGEVLVEITQTGTGAIPFGPRVLEAGLTPDGRGVMSDLLLRGGKDAVRIIPIEPARRALEPMPRP
ncbi:MAG: hypothetical protein ACKVZJ_00105 [Phycisphaerales bacterium]